MGFIGFYWVSLLFPEFYWVLLGFTEFFLVWAGIIGFYWVSLVFSVFHWVLLGLKGFWCYFLGFTRFYWVLLGFTGNYWVLPSSTWSFTEFWLTWTGMIGCLPGFCYWVSQGSITIIFDLQSIFVRSIYLAKKQTCFWFIYFVENSTSASRNEGGRKRTKK